MKIQTKHNIIAVIVGLIIPQIVLILLGFYG